MSGRKKYNAQTKTILQVDLDETVSCRLPPRIVKGKETEKSDINAGSAIGKPPDAWNKAAKDLWTSLPRAVCEAVSKREMDMNKGVLKLRKQMTEYEERLVNFEGWSRSLNSKNKRERAAAFLDLAIRCQLDLSHLYAVANPQPVVVAPVVPDIGASVRPVDDSVEQIVEQKLQQALIQEKIAAFASTHPHFDRVKLQMKAFAESGVEDLETAYRMACQANPEIRTEIEGKSEQDRLRNEIAKRFQTISKAKNAGSSLRIGAPAGDQSNIRQAVPKYQTVRESIRSAIHSSRG